MFTNSNGPSIQELSDVIKNWVNDTTTEIVQDPVQEAASITFNVGPGHASEMLRVAEDGFYVRGVRVPADDLEAAEVYRNFKSWLAWSQLSRD
jgi:hypothetical protein